MNRIFPFALHFSCVLFAIFQFCSVALSLSNPKTSRDFKLLPFWFCIFHFTSFSVYILAFFPAFLTSPSSVCLGSRCFSSNSQKELPFWRAVTSGQIPCCNLLLLTDVFGLPCVLCGVDQHGRCGYNILFAVSTLLVLRISSPFPWICLRFRLLALLERQREGVCIFYGVFSAFVFFSLFGVI